MKPFLKWAGGKYRLLQHIRQALALQPEATRLIEPFVGSGAVFLNTRYAAYCLADANADLIALYQILQAQGEEFIAYCQGFFTPQNNQNQAYYALREQFNTTPDPVLKAALFVYLNRHGFNGLCRYNARGLFNVPFGRYKQPYFPQAEMQQFVVQSQQAQFICQDFTHVMQAAVSGDVVYCDPPYVPLSPTASFTHYSTGGFTLVQQTQLAQLAQDLAMRGVLVLISNHDTAFTQAAYHAAQIVPLQVQRFISCNGSQRGKAAELLAIFHPHGLPRQGKSKFAVAS